MKAKTRWIVLSIAALVALLAAAVAVGMQLGRGDTSGGVASSAPTAAEPSTPAAGVRTVQPTPAPATSDDAEGTTEGAPSASSGDCAEDAVSRPAEAEGQGPAASWELVQGALLPFSQESGPTERQEEGPLFTCFEHSTAGAVVAAYHIIPRLYTSIPVVEEQVTDGGGRTQVLQTLRREGPQAAGESQLVAFRVESATDDSVYLTVVGQRFEDGGLVAVPARMVWADGDWKMSGSDTETPRPFEVRDLTGFVPWSGGSP